MANETDRNSTAGGSRHRMSQLSVPREGCYERATELATSFAQGRTHIGASPYLRRTSGMGRERADEAVVFKSVFKPIRYRATELTQLVVHDYNGLALDVRLLRHLYPEHRPLRHRIVREQERAIG